MEAPVSPNLIPAGLVFRGATLRYEITGAAQGTPVIVVHGGPGVGAAYLKPELTAELGATAPLVFYDQRASGCSTGATEPTMLTLAAFVDDLEALRSALALERVVLLAHSFGALVSLSYAARHPERVKALVLVEPDPPTKALWQSFAAVVERRQRPEDRREMESIQATPQWTSHPNTLSRFFHLAMSSMFLTGAAPEGFGDRFRGILPENLATPAAVRKSLGDWDLHETLSRIHCPTLLIFGEEPVFSAEAVETVHRGIPGSTLVTIPATSHFPPIEAPELVGREVRRFLELLECPIAT